MTAEAKAGKKEQIVTRLGGKFNRAHWPAGCRSWEKREEPRGNLSLGNWGKYGIVNSSRFRWKYNEGNWCLNSSPRTDGAWDGQAPTSRLKVKGSRTPLRVVFFPFLGFSMRKQWRRIKIFLTDQTNKINQMLQWIPPILRIVRMNLVVLLCWTVFFLDLFICSVIYRFLILSDAVDAMTREKRCNPILREFIMEASGVHVELLMWKQPRGGDTRPTFNLQEVSGDAPGSNSPAEI